MKLRQPGTLKLVHSEPLPEHIGVIMDGNGRWASYRGLPRTEGHRNGWLAALRAAEAALAWRIPWITFYALTAENWRRPRAELSSLLSISRWRENTRKTEQLLDQGVRLRVIGRPTDDPIARETVEWLAAMEARTSQHRKMTVTIAFNYSGQDEIVDALARDAELRPDRSRVLGRDDFAQLCYLPGMPELDLIIRTGGDERLSNFMLWHAAYAELLFTDTLFPDFTGGHLESALEEFCFRSRRFGGLPNQEQT